MQRNILWKGLDADTTENCYISFFSSAILVHSEISGWINNKPGTVEYYIKLSNNWDVLEFEVIAQRESYPVKKYAMKRESSGAWTDSNGAQQAKYSRCNYIDITLTPFTNSLPINGLKINDAESKDIHVIYIEEDKLRVDKQQYTKLNDNRYRFENDGGNFRADITVDKDGFVTNYPQLFEII
jgi:hypothetical protein